MDYKVTNQRPKSVTHMHFIALEGYFEDPITKLESKFEKP